MALLSTVEINNSLGVDRKHAIWIHYNTEETGIGLCCVCCVCMHVCVCVCVLCVCVYVCVCVVCVCMCVCVCVVCVCV